MPDSESEIPALKGEENLAQWDTALRQVMKMAGLEDYLTTRLPENSTEDQRKKSLRVYVLLFASTSLVHEKLTWNGWNYEDTCPVDMYNLIHKVVSRVPAKTALKLFTEYVSLRLGNFDGIRSYVRRLEYLKQRTERLGFVLNDAAHVGLALEGLKGYKGRSDLLEKFEFDNLTWSAFIEELSLQVS